ncbi:hypothetical protein PybrP1_011012 [[Pythium] brassicae (nom. inval.)]|nr:hypothetical protein PybrP1_011012 [[Pythium] brassicae (nom. inval.)]
MEREAAALGMALAAHDARSAGACDECEERPAGIECEDCGLAYCASCDAHRHRKGKLRFHRRQSAAPKPIVAESLRQPGEPRGAAEWSVVQVDEWLRVHDLDVFSATAAAHAVDGALLLSGRAEELFEAHSDGASRGSKKKLQREIQKLRAEQPNAAAMAAGAASTPTQRLPAPHWDAAAQDGERRSQGSARRLGVNLRVNVNASPAAAAAPQSFSPVTALRSRVLHGQVDDVKGRVNRRRSAMSGLLLSPTVAAASAPLSSCGASSSSAATAPLSSQAEQPKRSKSVVFAPSQLRIDVKENALLVAGGAASPPQRHETRAGGRADLRAIRQALGGLDLDILQVKNEERAVEASFDFSAEGRLQTQGFEIDTRGIASAPFPNQHASKKAAMGTRDYLVLLNELGHGAGGKVFKALYMPTFKLLAVKVIRVFDQKKRHQMVRELKSLYVNFVAINDADGRAACDELVVFYDAYTNPEIGSVSIVLEFMDRGSLEDFLQSGRRVAERELASMAHCISDFGISRDLESTLAKATTFTGTLLYMAPERISGGMYSYPSDIWSFGLAIMALAVGKLPVPTKDGYWGVVHAVQEQPSPRLADYGDQFSPALCDFIDQCLQKNPLCRPPAATLLEHAFIKENYSPHATPVPGASGLQSPLPPGDSSKALKELEHMASQVRLWCLDHADTLLSPTAATAAGGDDGPLIRQVSNRARVEALAHQLSLPVDTVASRFAFLDEYCS